MSPKPGAVVGGRYELVELAGEGGMAAVWKAVMRGAGGFVRPVAVKMIRPEFHASPEYVAMFFEEARVGAELAHANIVQVHDFFADDKQRHYLVMEWVEGMSLGRYVYSHIKVGVRTPWTLITAIGIEVLNGLGAAHARKKDGHPAPIIHRDVSPENILLGVNGAVKLSDFGLSRAKDRVARLTKPGTVKGKISYLSPEMTVGKDASFQSDLFAMGVCLWEALAHRKLFEGDPVEVFRKIMKAEITQLGPLRPDVPPQLTEVIHHALEPNPTLRYQNARQMAQALAAVLRTVPRISDGFLGGSVQEAQLRLHGGAPAPKGDSSFAIDVDFEDGTPTAASAAAAAAAEPRPTPKALPTGPRSRR